MWAYGFFFFFFFEKKFMASLFANQITFAVLIWWLEGLKFTILLFLFFFPNIMIMFPFYMTQFFYFFQLRKLINLNVGWSNLNFRKSKLLEIFYFSKRFFPLNLGASHEIKFSLSKRYNFFDQNNDKQRK